MFRKWFHYALVAAALVCVSGGAFAQDDTDDDGVFDLDELYPDAAKADGRLITDALYSHSPLVPRSLELSGAPGIEVPGSNRFDLGTWTIECWVRAGTPAQTCALLERTLIADPNNATFRVGLAAGVPYAEFVQDGRTSRVGGGAGQPLPVGAWTHLAAVFDDAGNSLSLYLNGGAKQAQSAVVPCPRGPGITTVGDGFTGHLDELRIWSAARTAADIAAGLWTFGEGARFNDGAGGSAGPLVAYYPFDDGGISAEDYTHLTNWAFALPTAAATTAEFARVWGDLDDDADGLPDWWERMFFASGDGDPDADDDGDGLENRTEYACDTNPFSDDSDGNGVVDAAEDTDHDGLENRDEQFYGTDPRLPDTDDDGLDDLAEAAAEYDPADSADPAIERALVLDGAPGTFVELPQDARFRLTDWTVEAWVQPTGTWAQAGTVLRRDVRPGEANLLLDIGATLLPSAGFGTNRVTAATPLPAGGTNWVYLATTYNSASRRLVLFVNGAKAAEKTVVGQPRTSGAGPIVQRIGEGFAGRVNEVRLWNTALADATIAARDLLPLTGAESGLVACYTFDDGTSYVPGSRGTSLNPAWQTGQVEDRLASLRRDWQTGWRHAATLAGGAVVLPVGTNVVPNLDFDGDGMPNAWEALYGLDPVDPTDAGTDADGDGLSNGLEHTMGLNPRLTDSDGNGTADGDEDYDADGMPNAWELTHGLDPLDPADAALDPDSDLLTNVQEFRLGLDPNTPDPDGDGDGMPNAWEVANGLDPADAADAAQDADGDRLTNLQEYLLGLDPNVFDADGDADGMPNDWELDHGLDPTDPADAGGDADGDLLTNLQEYLLGLDPNVFDADGDGDGMPNDWELGNSLDPTDPADAGANADGDGLSNLWEYRLGLDPNSADSDGNGIADGDEDADGDGMPNAWEIDNGLDPLNPADAEGDPDGDGLSNLWEYVLDLNPNVADSDGDGTDDGDEDADGDRLSNTYELDISTDPADPDSDDDGFSDGDELDANVSCGGRRVTSPLYSRSPVIQRSLVLDGTSRTVPGVSAADPVDRFNLDAWTVECWVNPGSTNETGSVIERTTARGLTNFALRLDGNVPSVQFTSRSGNRYAAGGTSRLPAGTWSYLAGVWNPAQDSLRLYVNGALYQAQQSVEPCEQGTNGVTRIGVGVNGHLDALRVWKRALTSAQIQTVHDQFGAFLPASFGGWADLVAWYPFDDGQNTSIVNPLSGQVESHGAEDYTHFLDWDVAITGVTFNADVCVDLPGDYDVDADGLPDWWEKFFLGGNAAPGADPDGDGVSNLGEYRGDTNPNDADTDNDGIQDGQEDSDADGLTDAEEQLYGTDALLPDTDDDGVGDNDEVSAGTDPADALDPWHPRALSLPGLATAYVDMPPQPRFALTDWTLEAWVQPAAAWSNAGVVIERSTDPARGNYLLSLDAARRVVAGFEGGTLTTTHVVAADGDAWTHLAATYDWSTRQLRVYIDGAEVTNRVLAAAPQPAGAGPLVQRVGAGFNGLIDEVRIWSAVRSAGQLAASRSVALAGTESGLVAYYMFDDGTAYAAGVSGTSLRDDWQRGQVQDFTSRYPRDWTTAWKNAATLVGGAELVALTQTGPLDADGDGMPDAWELLYGLDPTDPTDAALDGDGDGLSNLWEYRLGLVPINPDTDGDGVRDGDEDHDADGMPNAWEIDNGLDPLDPADADGDPDGDLLTNLQEFRLGLDPNVFDADGDGDGIPNDWELGNGLDPTDPADAALDPDGDGLSNLWEFRLELNPNSDDSDGNGTLDGDEDYDGDGMPNKWEIDNGLDPRVAGDADGDPDGDGVSNLWELRLGLDPNDADTDGDGISDGDEDGDGDGMPNAWEIDNGLDPTDPADAALDPDGDGLSNLWEYRLGLDPNDADTDDDGISDGDEDGDGDGIPNTWELNNGLDPTDPADASLDPDGDGLSNLWEYRLGLDPNNADSDGDGIRDGDEDADGDGMPNAWEIDNGLDPLDADDADADPDGDGLSNLWEYLLGLNPNLADSDGDGTADGDEDADGDRLSNAYELAIGTHPDDPDTDDDGFGDGDELDANVTCGGRRITNPLYSRSPVIQRSLVLDGTARTVPGVSADEPDDRFNLDAWTVECWVYPGSTSETGSVVERTTVRGLTNFSLRLDGNVPSVRFTSRSGNRYTAGGTTQLPAATWSYLAGVWDPDQDSLRLYVNGALYQAQQSVEPCEQGTNGVTRVGSGVTGYLDALRVWSTALSSDQVHDIYNQFGAFLPSSFGGWTELVAWYPFDDSQNTAIVNPLSGRVESHGAEDYTRFLDWDFAITGVTFSAGVYADLPGDYDVDADGMPDWWENVFLGGDADPDADADGDGLSNLAEYLGDTNPNDADTDNDGIQDGQEDSDADGLTDAEEQSYGTDATLPDTDDDGVGDNEEVSAGTDPTDALDAWHLRALSLPGSAGAYAELPEQARFALSNWTVEAWVRPASDWVAAGTVVERSVGPDQGNYLLGMDAARHVVAGFAHSTVTTTNVVPADGETWTHLAATFDGRTRRLSVCLDGSEVTNRVLSASPRTSGAGPLVQRIGGGFNGLVDDVRIWSAARTAGQLAAWRSVALLGTETGLVAYYMFDDGTSYRKGVAGVSGADTWLTGQAEDTLAAADRDWQTQWSHAATLRGAAVFSAEGDGATVLLPQSMTVSLRPEAIRDSNAQWRVWLDSDWSAWQSSGDVVRDLSVGTHSVEYTAVTGWLSPTSETVSIVATAAVARVRYYAWLVGEEGTAAGAFDEPRGLAADSNYLYVADSGNHRIQRMAMSDGVWTAWGGTASGSALGSFNQPFGIDVDAAGNVYVADSNNNRVQKRSAATGTWSAWGGTRGSAVGEFNAPFDVAVATNGEVFVADHYNHRIQKRSAAGSWSVLINSGFDNGQVRYPNGVLLDGAGHLFVSDHATSSTGFSRIQKFKTNGTFVEVVGSTDASNGGLWKPIFMAVSPKGDLYTADSGSNRVMRAAGAAAGAWSDVTGPHVLDEPWGVCVDRMGRLFVADTKAHRVLRFDIEDTPAFVVRASLSASADGLRLTWYGKRGWVYTVEARDSLSEGEWTALPGYAALSGSGDLLTVDIADTGRSRQRFYRVTGR